ncbi:MFS transporter [Kocuria palustris]|uniref:MFS transporter n=1 Tax=Kocuria palustris TaxID=71999 RepID=UPI0011A806C0|nr:MFS transporter [Kocuria palustris]
MPHSSSAASAAAPSPAPRILSRRFTLLWLIQFLASIQFYLLTTIAAVYAMEQFRAGETEAGLTTTAFTVGAIIARLITGKYMEIIGRKRVLVAGSVLLAVVSAAYVPDTGLSGLLLLRLINGAAFGVVTTIAPAAVQAVIPHQRRGEATGYFGMATTLATAIGPAVGVAMSQSVGYDAVFWMLTALCVISLLIVLVLDVPEVPMDEAQRTAAKKWTLSSMIETRALPVSAVMIFSGAAYSTVLAFLNAFALEMDLAAAAGFFFLIYAATIIVTRPFLGRLQDRRGDNAVLVPAFLLFAVAMSVLAMTTTGWMLLLVGVLLGCSFGAVLTAAQTAAVKTAPLQRVGLTTSTFFLCMDVGVSVGPVTLGALAPALGYRGMYFAAAIVVLVCLGYYLLVHGRRAGRGTSTQRASV